MALNRPARRARGWTNAQTLRPMGPSASDRRPTAAVGASGAGQAPGPEHETEEAQTDHHHRVGFRFGNDGADTLDGRPLAQSQRIQWCATQSGEQSLGARF